MSSIALDAAEALHQIALRAEAASNHIVDRYEAENPLHGLPADRMAELAAAIRATHAREPIERAKALRALGNLALDIDMEDA